MKVFSMTRENYELLKSIDFSEMGDTVVFDDATATMSTSDYGLLQVIINEEIAGPGMDEDQNQCNARGRALYALYDELLDLNAMMEQV